MPFLRLLFILIVLSSYGNLYAQDFLRVDKHEFAGESVEGKRLLKNIKKARKLYSKGQSASSECLDLLMECVSFNSVNAELNYNIGLCYLNYGQKDLALSYLEQVKKTKPNLNAEMYLLLGKASQYSNEFSNAILNYKIYSEILQHEGGGRNQVKLNAVLRYIEECKNGQVFMSMSSEFDVEKMPSPINSDHNDILAIKNGAKLYFNSDRKLKGDKKKNFEEGMFRGFSVQLKNGEWTSFSVLNDGKKSSELPLMVAKLDDNQYLFYDRHSGLGDLIFMQKNDNIWLKEMEVFFVNEKKSNESSASFTTDGNSVVFVSDRAGDQGDIFYSQRGADGKWSKPEKLGEQINSEYDERDVYLSGNGRVMYFSSRGHNSMGGYDIFKTEKDEKGNWMDAQNLGFPINTPYDECHFLPYEGNSFLFDSNRGKNGNFDIYTKKVFVDIDNVVEEKADEILVALEPVMPVEKKIVIPLPLPLTLETPVASLVEKVQVPVVIYKIQIAACRFEMSKTELKELYHGAGHVTQSYDGDWYRYTIGNYNSKEDAVYFKDKSGVKGAFVVSFENDKRTGIITNYSLCKK